MPMERSRWRVGSATISITGVVSIAGSLPDRIAFRSTGLLLENTDGTPFYEFFNSLEQQGEIDFGGGGVAGTMVDSLAANKSRYFPEGFSEGLIVSGTSYSPPASGETVLPAGPYKVVLSGGGLASAITADVTIEANDGVEVALPNTNKLGLHFTAPTGVFSGSFVAPAAHAATSFAGVIFQGNPTVFGAGGFLGPVSAGTAGVGSVMLEAP
jgi:hypothetical protein